MQILANGITVLHRRNRSNEIVGIRVLLRQGALAEPDAQMGRTQMMMRMLTQGTTTRTADQISEALEGMGASLSCGAGYDSTGLSLRCVRQDLPAAMEILADVLKNPTFPVAELDAEKQKALTELRVREDRSSSATLKRFRAELLGSDPYGRPVEGEPETVRILGQVDLVEAHRALLAPEDMIVAVVGDLSKDEAVALAQTHFGGLERKETNRIEARKSHAPRGGRSEFTRDVEQGFVVVGHLVAPIAHEDTPAVDVATAILGQGMSSRLFSELRDKRSLAYMVGASVSQYRGVGVFTTYIGTKPQSVDEAREGLWQQISLLREEPVPEDELERARNYLIGGYLRDHETNIRQAYYLAYWHATGLGVEEDERYPEKLRAVTARDVMRVANKYFNDPTVVILRPRTALTASAGPPPIGS